MRFKFTFRDIIPPILVKVFRRLQYKKLYGSYDEALRNSFSKLGYEENDIVKVTLEKTIILKANMDKAPVLKVDSVIGNGLLALGLAANNNELNVLDIGGACGVHYFIFKKILNNTYKLNWNIVETKKMCAAAKVLQNDELNFFDDLAIASHQMKKIDLIFSSGTIQVLKDPKAVLKGMTNLGAKYILLSRLSLTDSTDDLISIQTSMLRHNGIGKLPNNFRDKKVAYPHITMNENVFNAIIERNYTIKLKFDEQSDIHYLNNKSIFSYGLLLERK